MPKQQRMSDADALAAASQFLDALEAGVPWSRAMRRSRLDERSLRRALHLDATLTARLQALLAPLAEAEVPTP